MENTDNNWHSTSERTRTCEVPPHLRLYDGTYCKVQFQLELRDMWIGLFWRKTAFWHFYICLVPCLPLHITWVPRAARGQKIDSRT